MIATTNQDLLELIQKNDFREDLFYRLQVISFTLPPLRDRRGDIPLLAEYFLLRYAQLFDKRNVKFTSSALAALERAPWPGNIRQLENAVARGVLLAEGNFVHPRDLQAENQGEVLGRSPLPVPRAYPLYAKPLNPCHRENIKEPLDVGIRAINGLLTLGRGQRVGIFAGSGVGKSTLMGMMARFTRSDVSVIALIGERGREVKEFLDYDLGEQGLARSCVVAATSDTPPLARLRGAYLATAIAEYFRDQGLHVLLLLDSLTRFAMAAREIGLTIGEPPTARGYTPSVFNRLPGLLERAGACQGKGSITGIYTVLVEGDDLLEPIADSTRAILDGHIVLTRELADRSHYPAIDILGSISRLMPQVAKPDHQAQRESLVRVLASYRRAEDLVNINAYVRGSNPDIDYALDKIEAVNHYLRQNTEEGVSLERAVEELEAIFAP
jgi:flagellum-specific ATP synthase